MDALTTLRALNHLQLRRLTVRGRFVEAVAVQNCRASIDAVCSDDFVEQLRVELAARGMDVGFDLSGSS